MESGVCLEAGRPACLSKASIRHRPNICLTCFSLFPSFPSVPLSTPISALLKRQHAVKHPQDKAGKRRRRGLFKKCPYMCVCVYEWGMLQRPKSFSRHFFSLYKYHIIFKLFAVITWLRVCVCVRLVVWRMLNDDKWMITWSQVVLEVWFWKSDFIGAHRSMFT